jgi:23S rRNA-/tRNA-specific pseudouridylate synthase
MKLLDILSVKYNISKRRAKEYLKNGKVFLDNKKANKNIFIEENKYTSITLNINASSNININYNKFIIKNYENIIFLYKPPFIHTERQRLEDTFTIEDIIQKKFSNFKLISRLDYQTDGLIPAVNSNFSIFDEEKHYVALIHGILNHVLIINNHIDYKKRKKVKVVEQTGQNITQITPIKAYTNATIVRATIKKGLRHQIRAHLSYAGYPIYGDNQYGINDCAKRLMLTCYYVKINNYKCFSPYLKEFYMQVADILQE